MNHDSNRLFSALSRSKKISLWIKMGVVPKTIGKFSTILLSFGGLCKTRVCSCNIFNRRAKQLVKVICTLTYWTKPKILQWLWQCGSCIHTDRRLYNAYHKHLESHAPTIHLAPL